MAKKPAPKKAPAKKVPMKKSDDMHIMPNGMPMKGKMRKGMKGC